MDSVTWGVVVAGVGTAVASRVAGWKVARAQPGVVLDSDAFEARTSWLTDVVALVGMGLSGLVVVLSEAFQKERDTGILGAGVVVAVVAAALLAYLLWRSRHLMNGYPESLAPFGPNSRVGRLRKRVPFLLPGLTLSVLAQVALIVVQS